MTDTYFSGSCRGVLFSGTGAEVTVAWTAHVKAVRGLAHPMKIKEAMKAPAVKRIVPGARTPEEIIAGTAYTFRDPVTDEMKAGQFWCEAGRNLVWVASDGELILLSYRDGRWVEWDRAKKRGDL